MAQRAMTRPRKKRAGQYHHGDLQRALLDEALRTIHAEGVEQLTLRTVGEKLGVSRSALYRHFSGKHALLAAVGREGFRMLRLALTSAWEERGHALQEHIERSYPGKVRGLLQDAPQRFLFRRPLQGHGHPIARFCSGYC